MRMHPGRQPHFLSHAGQFCHTCHKGKGYHMCNSSEISRLLIMSWPW